MQRTLTVVIPDAYIANKCRDGRGVLGELWALGPWPRVHRVEGGGVVSLNYLAARLPSWRCVCFALALGSRSRMHRRIELRV